MEKGKKVKNSIGRAVFVALSILFQLSWIIFRILEINKNHPWAVIVLDIVALILVLFIYIKQINSTIKMLWIMLILVSPILGVCLYLLFGRSDVTKGMRKRFERIDTELRGKFQQKSKVLEELEKQDLGVANQSRYILNYGKYPVYENTDVEYYPDALLALEAQKEAMTKAKKYIFMEYFAIEDSQAFAGIYEILKKKVKEGVEVRILYDDVGSLGYINHDFARKLEKDGIYCRIFNPVIPFLNIFMNNRDHRKLTVIDGTVAFTGGYNLADEYFNFTHPYGQWKDTGIKMQGDAVTSMAAIFLQMWNSVKKTDTDYDRFIVCNGSLKSEIIKENEVSKISMENVVSGINEENEICQTLLEDGVVDESKHCERSDKGFVQPYADSPLDSELTGESVYLNIIKNAKRYVYFMTPYLIISDEMARELTLAAKRGVDVRIITPGIPDKKMVYRVTRSYYNALARHEVKIYEYTPGFCHGKMCLCDDQIATIGTINMDYRSLYLHFENGVFLYACEAIKDIKADFDATMKISENVTEKYKYPGSVFVRIFKSILRLVAPLL